MDYFLKHDYVLSSWFSKAPERVVPGTAFLFLNKVAFIWASLFFILTDIGQIAISTFAYVGILVLGGAIILYGFRNKLENYINKSKVGRDFQALSDKEIILYRLRGLLYFILSFIAIFVVLVIFYL